MRKATEARYVMPWPPSANNSKVRSFKTRKLMSTEALRRYKEAVGWSIIEAGLVAVSPPYMVIIDLWEPDRLRRDIANFEKAPIDVLVRAGVISDDSRIDILTIRRVDRHKGGRVVVTVKHLDGGE